MARGSLACLSWVLPILFLQSCLKQGNSVEASRRVFINPGDPDGSIISKQYRTAFHFQPPRDWINDPNGPMYYNGTYHLFYQYNPNSAVWSQSIVWAHSVSVDMINWVALEPTMHPDKPFDANGCWSGSATILPGNKPVILYTGIDADTQQVQNILFPKNLSDPLLREWTKPSYNPIMRPVDDINGTFFRDPTTGWLGPDGYWRVAVGAESEGNGVALLYKSKNFKRWVKAKVPLHTSKGSGMLECPDFFPVLLKGTQGLDASTMDSTDVKYVLKFSLFRTLNDHYIVGRYDLEKDIFVPDSAVEDSRAWLRIDYGNVYASKTFYDSEKRRRIIWGWSNESDSKADDIAKGWAGIQTAPRVVWLDTSAGQLVQWPIKELESLRRKEVNLYDTELKTGGLVKIKGIEPSQADVEVDFELPSLEGAEPFDTKWLLNPQGLCNEQDASSQGGIGPFGLLVLASHNLEEHTAVYFRIFKAQSRYMILMCSDQRRSSSRPELYKPAYGGFVDINITKDKKISLRTLVDHSVIESFGGGGRTCITARVYPALLLTGNSHIYTFNNGTETVKISELKAWSMDKPKINEVQSEGQDRDELIRMLEVN